MEGGAQNRREAHNRRMMEGGSKQKADGGRGSEQKAARGRLITEG